MSSDRPSLSESARAALLADVLNDEQVKRRLDELYLSAESGGYDVRHASLIRDVCAAYSAYLARTPLADVKPGALEEIAAVVKRAEDVIGELNDGKREWRMSIPARPGVDPDILIHDALHRQTLVIRDLRICAASLQERIAALIDENTKLKCELDGAMDGAACDLETIRHKTAEVAALTAERAKLDKECNEWMRQSVLLRAENEALTARAENATASPFIFQSLPLRVRDKMCSVVAEKLAAGGGLPTSHSERWYLAAALLDVAMPLPARTPPVPEDTTHDK